MRIRRFFGLFSFLCCFSMQALSDIPAPPSPADGCIGRKEGDECSFGFHRQGFCQQNSATLFCVEKTDEVNNASAVANVLEDAKESLEKAPRENTPVIVKGEAEPGQAGCNQIASFSSLFAFLSFLIGLFALAKVRKA